MSKTYTPGPKADAIIQQLVASGRFSTPDEAVRNAIELLEEIELEDVEALRGKIAAADAAYARGEYTTYESAEAMKADIIARGEARLKQKA